MDIFEKDRAGLPVSTKSADYPPMRAAIDRAQERIAQLNTGYHSAGETRALFSELTGQTVDESFQLLPPFYTDFGQNITVGKNVFINHCCEFMDRGGITIGDNVFLAPKVNLLTLNHNVHPGERHITTSKPIRICNNVWVGAAATVMPGVTIGENSIVSAGAVVTKDVPPNTIVAGVPAAVIKTISV